MSQHVENLNYSVIPDLDVICNIVEYRTLKCLPMPYWISELIRSSSAYHVLINQELCRRGWRTIIIHVSGKNLRSSGSLGYLVELGVPAR